MRSRPIFHFDRLDFALVDVLSDVLSTVHLTSSVFVQTELTAPWGIRADAQEHFAFHIVSRGRC
jgi:hypothetical protein